MTKFKDGMEVTTESGYTRILKRWTKAGKDRVYINGGSRQGDGYVDLISGKAYLNGDLTYQKEIAEMILAMDFESEETEKPVAKMSNDELKAERKEAAEKRRNALAERARLEKEQNEAEGYDVDRTDRMYKLLLEARKLSSRIEEIEIEMAMRGKVK